MAFSVKDWRNAPEVTTPLSAAALENLETRVTDYAEAPEKVEITGNRFAIGGTASARLPFNATMSIEGAAVVASGVTNVVGGNITTAFSGDFTGMGGLDPGFAWGGGIFALTGTATDDIAGLTSLSGGYMELALRSPSTDLAAARGAETAISWWGAAAGGTVVSMESLRVTAPTVKDGATAGTVSAAYGLFVEEVIAGTVGAISALSLYVDGGVSRFGGCADFRDDGSVVSISAGGMSLQGGYSATQPVVELIEAASGGETRVKARAANSRFYVHDGTSDVFSVDRTGFVEFNEQTAPAAPAANKVRLFARDVGGKTQLAARFASGTIQQVAIEP